MTYLQREEAWGYHYQQNNNQVNINPDGSWVEFSHWFDVSSGSYYNFDIEPDELDDLIEMLQEVREKVKELRGE